MLLELGHQEKLLRFLLDRQDLFVLPTLPPFVVRISLPYEMDASQTTPAKNYTYAFDAMPKAEMVRDAIAGYLRHVNDDRVLCEVLSLPEKSFYSTELKLYQGNAAEIPYVFLAEVLGEAEHRQLMKACFAKLSREECRTILLNSLDLEVVETGIEELTKWDPADIMKDALIALRK